MNGLFLEGRKVASQKRKKKRKEKRKEKKK